PCLPAIRLLPIGFPRSPAGRGHYPEAQRQVLPRRESDYVGIPRLLRNARIPSGTPRGARRRPSRNHTTGPFLPARMAPFFTATVSQCAQNYAPRAVGQSPTGVYLYLPAGDLRSSPPEVQRTDCENRRNPADDSGADGW